MEDEEIILDLFAEIDLSRPLEPLEVVSLIDQLKSEFFDLHDSLSKCQLANRELKKEVEHIKSLIHA